LHDLVILALGVNLQVKHTTAHVSLLEFGESDHLYRMLRDERIVR
jgi:hypothetical protein